jgi:uncharacterized protein (DUF2236 family)
MSRNGIQPMEDYGLFGPDSVTWRVWSYPTGLTVGFQRSVVIEELDPFLVASVHTTQKIVTQPRIRYDRTLEYFATIAFADTRSAVKASEILVKVHAMAVGVEPVSGLRYDANNPNSQLWIHLTAWHSILYAYELYGPGKLSEHDERRYWEEGAIAAELQTCDPDTVPRTREGIREYFEQMRPRLAASEATQAVMDHLLNAEVMFPPMPRVLRPGAWVVNRVLRAATIATMPRWQRRLAGLGQPRLVDTLIRPVMRLAFRVGAMSKRLELLLLRLISPATVPVVAPMLSGIRPAQEETLTPASAFEHHRTPRPIDLYRSLQNGAGGSDRIVIGPSAPLARSGQPATPSGG